MPALCGRMCGLRSEFVGNPARKCDAQSVDETTGFSANLLPMKAAPLEPEIITRKGKPVSVILPIKKYAELLEKVEDAEDIAWLRKARQKLSYRPLEEYVSEREKKASCIAFFSNAARNAISSDCPTGCSGLRPNVQRPMKRQLRKEAKMFPHASGVRNSHFAGEVVGVRGVLEYKPTGCPLGSRTRAMAPVPSGRLKGNPGTMVPPSSFAFLQLVSSSLTWM